MHNREVEACRKGIEKINAKLNHPANLKFALLVQRSAKRRFKREGTWRRGNSCGTTEKGRLLLQAGAKAGEVGELLKSDDPQTLRWAAFQSFQLGRSATLAKLGPELFHSADLGRKYKKEKSDGGTATSWARREQSAGLRRFCCERFAALRKDRPKFSKTKIAELVKIELGAETDDAKAKRNEYNLGEQPITKISVRTVSRYISPR